MKALKLYMEPDPMLRRKAEEVGKIDAGLLETFADMEYLMGRFDGIGLAGPQVGCLKRIIVVDAATIAREEKGEAPASRYMRLVNPRIISASKETSEREEGCLSVPTLYYSIRRPESVEVECLDDRGRHVRLGASGLLARCLQHEIDHLDGRLFIDYLSPLKRRIVLSKLRKMKIGDQ